MWWQEAESFGPVVESCERDFGAVQAIGIEENSLGGHGECRFGEEFGEVVDEMGAIAGPDAGEFRLLGQFQENLGAGQADV